MGGNGTGEGPAAYPNQGNTMRNFSLHATAAIAAIAISIFTINAIVV